MYGVILGPTQSYRRGGNSERVTPIRESTECDWKPERRFFATYYIIDTAASIEEVAVDVFVRLKGFGDSNEAAIYTVSKTGATCNHLASITSGDTNVTGKSYLDVARFVAREAFMNGEWWAFIRRYW